MNMKEVDYLKHIYQIKDSEVLLCIAKINSFKEKQASYPKTKPTELDKFLSTKASNKIAGVVTTNSRLWQLIENKTIPKNRTEEEILNYYSSLDSIHENYKVLPIHSNYIIQMYRNLFKFEELPNKQKVDILDTMCENYKNALKSGIFDSLVLIHCFVLDLLCLHLFNKGNGRISRLLNLLLLYKCGYFAGCYSSIASFIINDVNTYYETVRILSQRWKDKKNNPQLFIKYMLNVIISCYKDFELRQNFADYVNQTSYDVVKSFAEKHNGVFSKKTVLTACQDIGGRSLIEFNLKRLVREGFIKRVGLYASALYAKTRH